MRTEILLTETGSGEERLLAGEFCAALLQHTGPSFVQTLLHIVGRREGCPNDCSRAHVKTLQNYRFHKLPPPGKSRVGTGVKQHPRCSE